MHCQTKTMESNTMTTPDGRTFRIFSERMPPPDKQRKGTNMQPYYDWVPQPKVQGDLEQGTPTYGVDPTESWRLAMRMEMEKEALHVAKHNFNGDHYDGVGPQPEDSELPGGFCGYQRYGPLMLHVPETNQGFNDPLHYEDSAERDDIAWGPMATKELMTKTDATERNETSQAAVESMDAVEWVIDESTLPENRSNPYGVQDRAVPLPDVERPDVALYQSNQVLHDGVSTDAMPAVYERTGATVPHETETTYGRSTWNPNAVYDLAPHIDAYGEQWAQEGHTTEVGGYQNNGSVENVTGGQTHMGYKAQMREAIPTQEAGPQRYTPETQALTGLGQEASTWDHAGLKGQALVRSQDQTRTYEVDGDDGHGSQAPTYEVDQLPYDSGLQNVNSVNYQHHLIEA
jgi:hypothetical protein